MSEVGSGFYSVDDLTVRVPRFKVRQRLEMVPALQRMGLEDLFDGHRADLGGFLEEGAEDVVSGFSLPSRT